MKVLVCGDRNWVEYDKIRRRLELLPKEDTIIIHGAARGADTIAGIVGYQLNFKVKQFTAQWLKYGKAAGAIRNKEMLDQKPDLVIAFHSNLDQSKGTKNCINEAKRRGIPVEIIS